MLIFFGIMLRWTANETIIVFIAKQTFRQMWLYQIHLSLGMLQHTRRRLKPETAKLNFKDTSAVYEIKGRQLHSLLFSREIRTTGQVIK